MSFIQSTMPATLVSGAFISGHGTTEMKSTITILLIQGVVSTALSKIILPVVKTGSNLSPNEIIGAMAIIGTTVPISFWAGKKVAHTLGFDVSKIGFLSLLGHQLAGQAAFGALKLVDQTIKAKL